MKTILVAEDEFDLLNTIQIVLEEEGYRVITCTNGRDALQALRDNKPDLFLTDVMMPHLSGWEVLTKLREEADLKNVRTIVMSALREPGSMNHAMLPKPFTIEQLISLVSKEINK